MNEDDCGLCMLPNLWDTDFSAVEWFLIVTSDCSVII